MNTTLNQTIHISKYLSINMYQKHQKNTCNTELVIVVLRNSVFNGKTQLREGGQTKLAYFFLLKITYRITY